MDAIRVLADDLTGACDVGAELLPWPGGVAVEVGAVPAPGGVGGDGPLRVRNTQSRTLAAGDATLRVAAALRDVGPGWAGLVLKKMDTALRGQLGAEIDAAMDRLGIEEAFVLPAIPEIGRTTQQGRQMIGGVPVDQTAFARDPQNPIREASVPLAIRSTGRRTAAVIGLGAVRGAIGDAGDAARAAGAQILVCDAETDGDLERAVRGLLLRPRPLLLVGSTGLARALHRVLATERGGRRPMAAEMSPASGTGILLVAGSAHPTTRTQVDRALARGLFERLVVANEAQAEAVGQAAGRLLRNGRATALVAPIERSDGGSGDVLAGLRRATLTALARVRPRGLALVGGETAYGVLEGLGLPPLWLESRLCPMVVRARIMTGMHGGLPVVTKGGSTGGPEVLDTIVRQLARDAY
jgi:D-threonate/D-erythronate kinase